MTCIARALAGRGFTLRSGGAPGADAAFEAGTTDGRRREIYLPVAGWRGSASELHPEAIGKDCWGRAREITRMFHPAWDRVSEHAERLLVRDTFQVLGQDLQSPSQFVIAWTEDGAASGGTGQAIRIAEAYEIPVLNIYDDGLLRRILKVLR